MDASVFIFLLFVAKNWREGGSRSPGKLLVSLTIKVMWYHNGNIALIHELVFVDVKKY